MQKENGMANLITNSLRINNAKLLKKDLEHDKCYAFIGKQTAWANEEEPDCPNLEDDFFEKTSRDIIAYKAVQSNSTSFVVPRYDWIAGTVYDAYDSSINMVDDRKSDNTNYIFYVVTDERNVYKCIESNGKPSTIKPTGKSYNYYTKTSDGYVWKYMYSISEDDMNKFALPDWMPIYDKPYKDDSDQWKVQESTSTGKVTRIVIEDAGSDYSRKVPPIVRIVGDGTGATATVNVSTSNKIESVVITNHGSGYTRATVEIDGSNKSAKLRAVLEPKTGHGKNPMTELGGSYLAISVELNGNEENKIPLVEYRQTGLIKNIKTKEFGTAIKVVNHDAFNVGDTITGLSSKSTATIVAKSNELLYIKDSNGVFVSSEKIKNNHNKLENTIDRIFYNVKIPANKSIYGASEIEMYSGDLLYIVNRVKIVRETKQKETLYFIISF